MAGKGILLAEDGDLLVVNKSLAVGSTEMQEVAIILSMNQGEQKFHPLIGANLVQMKKANVSKFDIEKRVRVALARDGKDYSSIQQKIKTIMR